MPTPPTPRSAPPRILFSESKSAVGRLLCVALEQAGFSVRAFRSSDAALHAFNTEPPFDLVLTDRAPPGLPGLLLVASLRERGFTGPAILIVEGITTSESVEAERLGVVRLLHKPLHAESLVAAIREVLFLS